MKSLIKNFVNLVRQLFHRPIFTRGENSFDEYWVSKRGDEVGVLNEFQQKRLNFVKNTIPAGSKVLDFGCGDGAILAGLGVENYELFGADLSDLALARVEQQGITPIKFNLETSDISELPSCDYIMLLEVLEHVSRPEDVLMACIDHADKGVIFSIPNTGHISHRLRLLFGKFPLQWRVHPGEHLRYWTLSDLKWWLRCLNISEITNVNVYMGSLRKLYPSLFGRGLICHVDKSKKLV